MPRNREQFDNASHLAGALYTVLIEERALRQYHAIPMAESSDRVIDNMLGNLAASLGYTIVPAAAKTEQEV